jgi:hypothetical protein
MIHSIILPPSFCQFPHSGEIKHAPGIWTIESAKAGLSAHSLGLDGSEFETLISSPIQFVFLVFKRSTGQRDVWAREDSRPNGA